MTMSQLSLQTFWVCPPLLGLSNRSVRRRRRRKDSDEDVDGGVSSQMRMRIFDNEARWTIYVRGEYESRGVRVDGSDWLELGHDF